MPRFAQIVLGPAGSGKVRWLACNARLVLTARVQSTYCDTIQQHAHASKRAVHVINLDPAAEAFPYECAHGGCGPGGHAGAHLKRSLADVRDLISLDDVAEELKFGPNGGLVFCMEYLLENLDWLRDIIDQYGDDDYLVFDLPGRPPQLQRLQQWLMMRVQTACRASGAVHALPCYAPHSEGAAAVGRAIMRGVLGALPQQPCVAGCGRAHALCGLRLTRRAWWTRLASSPAP